MEALMKQIRAKFTGAEENKPDLMASTDQKIPVQPFKEKKNSQNWFQRQISRNMSHDYDSIGVEHATAVAAAAYAIKSQEEVSEILQETKISDAPETSLAKPKSKVFGTKPSFSRPPSKQFSGSFKSSSDQGNKVPISSVSDEKKPEKTFTPAPSLKKKPTFSVSFNTDEIQPENPEPKKTPTFGDDNLINTIDDIRPETPEPQFPPPPVHHPVSLRPPPPPPPPPSLRLPTPQNGTGGQTLTRPSAFETKADAWERNELLKIKERFENLIETIDSWEKRKKMKARRKLNKQQQRENEQKRGKALKKYQSKMSYIDEIAAGARAEAVERRRNEELKAKEKANIIRTTGKIPWTCSCF